jgi:polysaccharide biosynthesis protein PslG
VGFFSPRIASLIICATIIVLLGLSVGCSSMGFVGTTSAGNNNQVPVISGVSPASVMAGTTSQVLTVSGSGFLPTSSVNFGSSAHAATYVSATQLKITLATSDLSTAGSVQVTVTNPAPGGGTSAAAMFSITSPNSNPVPAISSLLPASVVAGTASQLLTVNGTGFIPASSVVFKGSARATTYLSASQLTITLMASDLSTAGSASVTVTNQAPGGGTSAAATFSVTSQSTAGAIPPTFMNMTVQYEYVMSSGGPPPASGGGTWPSIKFGGIRLWDTYTQWNDINTSDGVYDWTTLDMWLNAAQAHNLDVLYTFGGTPTWASSNPNYTGCSPQQPLGQCLPPAQMSYWDNFVKALVAHAAGRIKYWEIWNEAQSGTGFWEGGIPPLVAMAKDAYAIIKAADPNAIVLTPSSTGGASDIPTFLSQWFAGGGGSYVDAVAIHGYSNDLWPGAVPPEDFNNIMDVVYSTMASHGQSGKPVWDTEASWGPASNMPVDSDQVAYIARHYILHWSRGVQHYYWYAWQDQVVGSLWDPSNGIHPAGTAYTQVYNWLTGAAMSTQCSADSNSTWTCGLTRPNGYTGLIIWNPNATLSYVPAAQFVKYRDLSGNTSPVTGSVSVGPEPILLENQ